MPAGENAVRSFLGISFSLITMFLLIVVILSLLV